jgi:uncharacterized membrane protein YfhO
MPMRGEQISEIQMVQQETVTIFHERFKDMNDGHNFMAKIIVHFIPLTLHVLLFILTLIS